MPETNTIPAATQRALTDLKAGILDAADDALLDAYALGRDAGLTEQQAKLDHVVAERARTTNHLYGLLQLKDTELVRAANQAADYKRMADKLDNRASAAEWDLEAHRIRAAQLEHDLRVSQANHATDRERLDTEIRNHQKTRTELAAEREARGMQSTVGGPLPASRIGEKVYLRSVYKDRTLDSQTVHNDGWQALRDMQPENIRAVEFPVGHVVWAATIEDLAEVRRLHSLGQ